MRDDVWSRRRIKADRCKFADPWPVRTITPDQQPRRSCSTWKRMGPQWRIVPAYPVIFFGQVQRRTLMFTLKAFIALVVTWCLLAVAAVVAASTQRFEGLYMYLVAAAVLVGLVILAAIAIAP